MSGTTVVTRQQKRWEHERQQVVYPAYDSLQTLTWALANPTLWRRKKGEVKKVKKAFRTLGTILRENSDVIGGWFGDDEGAVVQWMREVREKIRKLIPH